MKDILIASFDLEVGGVERSLINLLDHFDYSNYQVDLMLYRHQGDFLPLLTNQVKLINEIPQYTTFRKSIKEIAKERHFLIAITRLLSKWNASLRGKLNNITEPGNIQMQLMWKYTLPFLPHIEKEYDVAISYLWPHDFVAKKVTAKKKIAWIHTDFSTIKTDIKIDREIWKRYDYIIAVSVACGEAFLEKHKELKEKVRVIENMTSPTLIRQLAQEQLDHPFMTDNRFKVLTVARLSHAKGIDLAIKALKKLKDKGYHDIAWYVVGYGGDEAKLKKLISSYGLESDFYLLGKQINPYPFMKTADLYAQPSRYEGKAVTVREAQILAKPVLITNYSTAISQVIPGINGFICDQSIEGIVTGIKRLYLNREQLNRLSKNCAASNYENRKELEKLYQLV